MALELVKLDDQTLPAIANAIRAKTGDSGLLLPSQMAGAIAGIQTGVTLPALSDPAAVGHVLAGKEYIDGNGDKKSGTLVVCDTIREQETTGLPGVGVQVELESTADGSTKTMTLPEPNLQPENIKSGISIFGIQGSLVGGGAKEPYIEEIYDANGNLVDVNLVGYTAIRPYVFRDCQNLALTSLPSGITSISLYAFSNCTMLTSITFNGKPNSIHSTAFNECTNLKTINVPWASGEVANAPWGATNATINYNYTG